MEFCPECGAMLLPNDNKLKCACGYTKDLASDNNEYSVHQEVKGKQGVVDMGEVIDLDQKSLKYVLNVAIMKLTMN